MQRGIVKSFNEKKGFGFIKSEGKDYFVHFKQIQVEGFKTLNHGDYVTFIAETSPKGYVATNVFIEK